MMEEEFRPKRCIVLSELTTREKEKYYQLLLINNARFVRDDQGRYITNIRLLAPGVKRSEVVLTNEQKKRKENNSNYALVFQERLTKLRQNGFISVNVLGIRQNNYDFNYNTYPRFVALIAFDQESVKPKLRPLSWVMKLIEDIYDSRFAHEKHDVEREEEMSSFDLILLIFPIFVVRRLGTNVGLKSLVDQTCWDLLYSVDYYRNDYLECELFGRFLQEFYDHNDLLFYLYVRSVISKVLHVNFKNRWTTKFDGPGRQPQSIWMSYREALHITGIIFGKDNREMVRDFMSMITPQMVGNLSDTSDSRRIDITEYLHLSVVGYHQSQSRNQANGGDGGDGERYLVPLPGQIAPIELIPKLPQQKFHEHAEGGEDQEEEHEPIYQENIAIPSRGHVLGVGSHNSKEEISAAAEAYDLDDEERGYQEEYKAAVDGRMDPKNRFQGPGDHFAQPQHFGDPFSPIAQDPMLGEHVAPNPFDQSIAFDQSQGIDFMPNAFEQLQLDRENEFMIQLCQPLGDAPPDIFEYVSSTLRDRLHQTVRHLHFINLVRFHKDS
jgi:hypothetical protein